ncbi:MAG TPA: FxLYD domain-containing protein [Methanoregula sp.]|nr:FxLYD domain-containing protein [Methanoregula sp.]
MNAHRLMPVAALLLLSLAAILVAGCTSASPGGPSPGAPATIPPNLNAKDCFFEVDDSAHSVSYGDVREITITGHVSNICSIPMDRLTVRATFYDTAGKRLASADGYAGRVGFHEIVPFTLTADIPSDAGAFRYTLEPVFLR